MRKIFILGQLLFISVLAPAQKKLEWKNVDSAYGPLPKSVHVFYTDQQLDNAPFRAFYVIADLKDKKLDFTTDTTLNRRLTPSGFYEKNGQPLIVVNGTFFSFSTHQNLNVVIKDGIPVSFNVHSIAGRGKDTLTYRHPFTSAIGISKNRKADVAFVLADSTDHVLASQQAIPMFRDSINDPGFKYFKEKTPAAPGNQFERWQMQTAIGGGPALIQAGQVKISNNEEWKFAGIAINDKHPRTAMGYTADNKLIILVIEGRNPAAAGASLVQEAEILRDLGCQEALNLDGGGSSCLLVNGKETIAVSDKKQRAVPAVFIISNKK